MTALEAAGWANAGKANLHEFAYGITSQNPHFGDVPNPAFPGRVAGGSSGGCAAALASGEADLGLGTDSGGSIRIPAACCEVVGFKPSFGLVAMDGCFPLAPSFDHAGPHGGGRRGLRRGDGRARGREPARARRARRPRGRGRVARARRAGGADPGRGRCGALPARRAVDLPLPEGLHPAFQARDRGRAPALFTRHRDKYGTNVGTKIARALCVCEGEADAARDVRERYRERFAAALEGVDLVASPTLPIEPPPADVDELEVRER